MIFIIFQSPSIKFFTYKINSNSFLFSNEYLYIKILDYIKLYTGSIFQTFQTQLSQLFLRAIYYFILQIRLIPNFFYQCDFI